MNKKTYTYHEVFSHNNANDCWMIIDEKVLDLTEYLEKHPGGSLLILDNAGMDGTKPFKDLEHSREAVELLKKYEIGILDKTSLPVDKILQIPFGQRVINPLSIFSVIGIILSILYGIYAKDGQSLFI